MDDIIIPESPFYALSYKQHEYERDRRSFFLLKPYAKQKKREIGAYINILISLL